MSRNTGLLLVLLGAGAAVVSAPKPACAQGIAVSATILPEVRLSADAVIEMGQGGGTVSASARAVANAPGVISRLSIPPELLRRLKAAPEPGAPALKGAMSRRSELTSQRVAGPSDVVSYTVIWTVVPKG